MASSPESYAVEREFAESMEDPFEAIIELRAKVEYLETLVARTRKSHDDDIADLEHMRTTIIEPQREALKAQVRDLEAKLKENAIHVHSDHAGIYPIDGEDYHLVCGLCSAESTTTLDKDEVWALHVPHDPSCLMTQDSKEKPAT